MSRRFSVRKKGYMLSYATAALSGLIFSHSEYMEAVEAATVEDVVACANSLTLHTTYFLKGGSR